MIFAYREYDKSKDHQDLCKPLMQSMHLRQDKRIKGEQRAEKCEEELFETFLKFEVRDAQAGSEPPLQT